MAARAGTAATTAEGAGTAGAVVARAGTAAAATAGAGTTATVVAVGAGPWLELLAREGEGCHTLGRKLCPPHVFTMAGLDKEKRWRGWEEERFHK